MTNETAVDLSPFIDANDPRPYLRAPIIQDGHIYATTGRILARVPAGTPVTPEPVEFSGQPKGMPTMVAEAFAAATEWVDAPLTEAVKDVECDQCGGSGALECPTCGHEDTCEHCGGTGFTTPLNPKKIADRVLIAQSLLHIISSLPGAKIGLREDPLKPHAFTWEHGEGIVMPCRHEE
jgi:hypothetical protein